MDWVTLLIMALAIVGRSTMGAPQGPQQVVSGGGQQQQSQQPLVTQQVAQSREAAVYSDGGYGGGGGGGGGQSQQYGPPAAAYGAPQAPQAAYGAPAASSQQQQGGYGGGGAQGGGGQPGGGNGYYYYYYPVQESKSDYGGPGGKEGAYTATDSYGIDPIGIVSILAIAGLVIAGLALLFPGWAYVKSDEHVYYRSNTDSPTVLGLSKEDYKTLTTMVMAAIEGEDCFEKMMCNAGILAKKVKKADTYLRFMETLAPPSISQNIKKLRTAMKKPEECKTMTCGRKKKL